MLEREDIYQRVWGYTMARGDRSVDVFVRKLRQKLEQISPGWRYVHTHFGVGYRFAAEPIVDEAGAVDEPPARQGRTGLGFVWHGRTSPRILGDGRTCPGILTRGFRRGTLSSLNSTVRNVLIVLVLAAIVGTLSGGVTAANVAIQAVTLAFLGTAVLVRLDHVPPAPEHAVLTR